VTNTSFHKPDEDDRQSTSLGKLVWVGPLAVIAAILANVLFYYFVTLALQVPLMAPEQFPPPDLSPIPVTDILIFSLIFSVGAVIVFALVVHFSRRPIRTYLIVCFIVLILSLFLPLRIPTPPVPMATKWSLVMMHMIGGIVVVGTLVMLCSEKASVIHEDNK